MAAGPATSRPTKRRSKKRKYSLTLELLQTADRLDPLPIRVLEEGRKIILGKILADRRRAIILAAGFDAQAMKGFDRLARHGPEGNMDLGVRAPALIALVDAESILVILAIGGKVGPLIQPRETQGF